MATSYGIFSIDRNDEVKLALESLKLCPELLSLDKNYIKYIILVYDWDASPLCRLPEEERRVRAKRMIWKDDSIDPESKLEVREAIEMYLSLIYNPLQETVSVYKRKLHELNELIVEQNPEDMIDTDKAITIIKKRLIEAEKEFSNDVERVELKGDNQLSLLERLKRNRKLWTELKKPTNE